MKHRNLRVDKARIGSGILVRPANASKYAREIVWTRADEVEVGYRYRRSARGRGVATEAATLLVRIALADPATTAVVACALAGNTGSLRVSEKLTLKPAGEVMLPETSEPTLKLARAKQPRALLR
jgi:RimJ/RimL family protein N-acetyltransferase